MSQIKTSTKCMIETYRAAAQGMTKAVRKANAKALWRVRKASR